MATITERYSDADCFTAFLTRIELSESQRDRLIQDDFETMEELLSYTAGGTSGAATSPKWSRPRPSLSCSIYSIVW